MKNTMLKNLTSVIAIATVLALGACAPQERAEMKRFTGKGSAIDSLQGKNEEATARLATAAQDAIAEGKEAEALALYKRLYVEKPEADVAVNYAQLLRKTGKPQQASEVLAKFVSKKGKGNEDALLLNEYAATQIALGNFDAAAEKLDRVLADGTAAQFQADASNLKGVALDAQGRHKEAEGLFRVAMEGWEGNPTSVMNNLALCLANQGRFDEALDILRRALVMAPDKQEIARNINLIGDLRTNVVPVARVTAVKAKTPAIKKTDAACAPCPTEPAKAP